jgi:hypothetical protein
MHQFVSFTCELILSLDGLLASEHLPTSFRGSPVEGSIWTTSSGVGMNGVEEQPGTRLCSDILYVDKTDD